MRLAAQNPFQPVQKTRAVRAIEAQIRDLIAGGQVKAGDRLPSERVLAHALGVGRSTLREAIRVLQVSGLLDVRPGGGTFLAAPAALPRPADGPQDFRSRGSAPRTAPTGGRIPAHLPEFTAFSEC